MGKRKWNKMGGLLNAHTHVLPLSLSLSHARTHRHSLSLSVSLSLSLAHMHTHTQWRVIILMRNGPLAFVSEVSKSDLSRMIWLSPNIHSFLAWLHKNKTCVSWSCSISVGRNNIKHTCPSAGNCRWGAQLRAQVAYSLCSPKKGPTLVYWSKWWSAIYEQSFLWKIHHITSNRQVWTIYAKESINLEILLRLTLKKLSRATKVDTHNFRATAPMHKSYHAYECIMSP